MGSSYPEGNFGGNQLLDGSISLSPLYPSQTNDLHVGSGMIGLQEMLLQTNGEQILLFPAWPKEWNVHFKLHAPGETTVEATLKNGKVTDLKVLPESRKKDIVIMIENEK